MLILKASLGLWPQISGNNVLSRWRHNPHRHISIVTRPSTCEGTPPAPPQIGAVPGFANKDWRMTLQAPKVCQFQPFPASCLSSSLFHSFNSSLSLFAIRNIPRRLSRLHLVQLNGRFRVFPILGPLGRIQIPSSSYEQPATQQLFLTTCGIKTSYDHHVWRFASNGQQARAWGDRKESLWNGGE